MSCGRDRSCFGCWHGRRVDGARGLAVCVLFGEEAAELILRPYRGDCPSWEPKAEREQEAARILAREHADDWGHG